jgi:hypothetical protein
MPYDKNNVMNIFKIEKITSTKYCPGLSRLSSNVAAEAYGSFSDKEILHQWLRTNTSEAIWRDRIEGNKSAVYGAFFENEILGSVWAASREGIHNTDSYIGGLYVAAPGQGIATSLLNHAELRIATWGCWAILAEVAENSLVKKIMSERGYDVLGHHPGRNFKDVAWAEMRKLLVRRTDP